MGRIAIDAMKDPYMILHERARAYVLNKRVQVHVFSKYPSECSLLIHTFGGNKYKHGSGFTWIISKRSDLVALINLMADKEMLPSQHLFEALILENYC